MRWQTSSDSDPRFDMTGTVTGPMVVTKKAAYDAVRKKCEEVGLELRPEDLVLRVLAE